MPKTQPAARAGLDQTDLAILRALALDANLTHKALSARLGLAESTCAYRIRALRDRGVIRGTRVQLALDILGFPIQAVIKVRLGSHDRDHVNRLYADLTRVPGVLQALHVAGDDDFHLHVAAESPRGLARPRPGAHHRAPRRQADPDPARLRSPRRRRRPRPTHLTAAGKQAEGDRDQIRGSGRGA